MCSGFLRCKLFPHQCVLETAKYGDGEALETAKCGGGDGLFLGLRRRGREFVAGSGCGVVTCGGGGRGRGLVLGGGGGGRRRTRWPAAVEVTGGGGVF